MTGGDVECAACLHSFSLHVTADHAMLCDCEGFETRAALDRSLTFVSMDHPEVSHEAARKALARSGTLRSQVLALVAARGERGATSDEIERLLNKSHQSISSTLHGLDKDGLAERTGARRPTQYGSDALVYTVTDWGLSELDRVRETHAVW